MQVPGSRGEALVGRLAAFVEQSQRMARLDYATPEGTQAVSCSFGQKRLIGSCSMRGAMYAALARLRLMTHPAPEWSNWRGSLIGGGVGVGVGEAVGAGIDAVDISALLTPVCGLRAWRGPNGYTASPSASTAAATSSLTPAASTTSPPTSTSPPAPRRRDTRPQTTTP